MIRAGTTEVLERMVFLRRHFLPRHRLICSPVPAVAFVNVLLLLFFFYAAHSRFVLQPGILVSLPSAGFVSGTPYGSMVVTISQEGLVFFNDEQSSMENLESAFSQALREHPETTLVIEADGRVRNSTLVEVYNMALAAGVKQVSLATRITALPGESL
jgi:biopolymer transport protein ExbD